MAGEPKTTYLTCQLTSCRVDQTPCRISAILRKRRISNFRDPRYALWLLLTLQVSIMIRLRRFKARIRHLSPGGRPGSGSFDPAPPSQDCFSCVFCFNFTAFDSRHALVISSDPRDSEGVVNRSQLKRKPEIRPSLTSLRLGKQACSETQTKREPWSKVVSFKPSLKNTTRGTGHLRESLPGNSKRLWNLKDPLPTDIWELWEGIDQQMAEKNLIMFPPLPEARDGEDVRIYRKDAPLTRVLEAMLFPTAEGDLTLARAISALNVRPAQQNHKPQARPQVARPRESGPSNGHGAPKGPERLARARNEHRSGPRNNDRRGGQRKDRWNKGLNGHPKRNQDSQAGNGQADDRAGAWQEHSRNFFRPLA